MNLSEEQKTYWRRKLSAFMHDNPSKAFDIKHHEIRAFLQRQVDELKDTERYDKTADFNASAADRLPFPHAGKLRVDFSLGENHFHHPLSSEEATRFPINSK